MQYSNPTLKPQVNPGSQTSTGSVTLPVESGKEQLVKELIQRWGADAIRDSDGTQLSEELKDLDLDIYSVICLVRAEQDWPRKHPERLPQKYLMSDPVTATTEGPLTIKLLKGFHPEKYRVDTFNDCKKYWEVINRTTGELLPADSWSLNPEDGTVLIDKAKAFQVYTASFLAFVTWDATSMHNHITNNWKTPKVMSVDPYHRETREHLMGVYEKWLEAHPQTNVVRLTTLAYHFAVDSGDGPGSPDRFRDWTGYQETLSVEALEDFAREYGYRMRAEDFVDQGYYNHTSRVPSKRYLDWMDFIHRFVVDFGKEMVDRAKAHGKKTGIFWGDHWAGVEPYSPDFQKMGIDIHIGAAEDGAALRRVSDAPGPQIKELRFYPYFFPDVFSADGDPIRESQDNWIKIRRALLRQPVDRIGYGGYLSLAAKFPDFVEHVSQICNEFRVFKEQSQMSPSWKAPLKVGVLNAWGEKRAWINSFGIPQKFLVKRPDVIQVAGTNVQECLAGLPVEVVWLSFDEVEHKGIPDDIDVLINDGDTDTAWSGGWWWMRPGVISEVRRFVHAGGGFVGCREPSAHIHNGRVFQLADVLGVDKEIGFSTQTACPRPLPESDHFIRTDSQQPLDLGLHRSNVFAASASTRPILVDDGHILVATNTFGSGRSVYLAELPYSLENSRLLYRSLLWASQKEDLATFGFSTNPLTDCAVFPEQEKMVITNNSDSEQQTTVYDHSGISHDISLSPYAYEWIDL
ncbi:MAG: 1,3-beta-galactosyl-N-acetylhexosamine phosphorylase [Opitutales bacterium]|nr:1,3-beta-galactosyl-N-acetylhexosamine phosphorylase [Opitutales bacterium]